MTMHSSSSAHASYTLLLTNEKNSPLHTVSTISDTVFMVYFVAPVHFQDADFDTQSQSSYDRALSERGHSQMSSDDTWKGRSNASEHTSACFFIQSVKWIIAAWIPVLISPHLYTFLCCRSFRPEAVCRPADQMCRAAWINTDRRQHCLLPSHQQEGGCW